MNDALQTDLSYHYFVIGRVLAHMSDGGMRRQDISEAEAFAIMQHTRGDESSALQEFADVMHFLVSEGVLRASNIEEYAGGFTYFGVQLTSIGLQLLKQEDETGKTAISQIQEAKASSDGSGMYSKVGEFVGSMLASFTKSIGSG